MKHASYILKVTDARKADIRKALKEAGIEVRALVEIFAEETEQKEDNAEEEGT